VLIDVHYRKVIAILDSVPGLRSATAKVVGVTLKPELKGTQAVVSVRNTGDILFKGKGTVALIGSKGTMQHYPFTIDTILPSAVAQIPIYLPNLILQPGTYGMHVQLLSLHNVSLTTWQNQVGFMLAQHVTPGAPIKPVLLQPAQAATAQAKSVLGAVSPATSSQSIPYVLLGALAILVLALGAGLGVVLSRRSTGQHA
jgi:hypothetical protein